VAKPGTWTVDYNFQKTCNVIRINAMTLARLRQQIFADTVYRNRYINLCKVSNPTRTGSLSRTGRPSGAATARLRSRTTPTAGANKFIMMA